MERPTSINDYLRVWAPALGERIVEMYPALQTVSDPVSPLLGSMLRQPFPAQALAVMGVVRRWQQARTAALIAECGTGKTLMSLAAIHCHSDSRPFTALAMVPPQLVKKWAREALLTLPRVRVFLIDGLRGSETTDDSSGVNEVRLRGNQVIREGLRTSLSELRLRRNGRTARSRWHDVCGCPAIFVVGRERAKLGYYWKHSYTIARSGRFKGIVVNPETGQPVVVGDDRLCLSDFDRVRVSEVIGNGNGEGADVSVSRRQRYSPLWQADRSKTRRYAPIEFIGRYMHGFFDYAIADEVHELKGDTAQGNALATLAGCADRIAVLTGTLLGGYADELFNILFRLEPRKMITEGFEHGEGGCRQFSETYGVLEKITELEPEENACSKAKTQIRVRRRPGASPLLFGRFLMSLAAFVSLEDISSELPPYAEEVIAVEMDPSLREAYSKLEEEITQAIKDNPGNSSVMSIAMNALMLYPDRPFGMDDLYGYTYNKQTQERERFLIASPADLNEDYVYAKEQRLVEEVKAELSRGRRCQIYAVYTQKRDVTRRLARILAEQGVRVAVLTAEVKPEARESWYERQLSQGIDAVICHPRLVQTGLDLLGFPTIIFYETGYSIYTLRQASRRSWRIGQRRGVKVKFIHYQESVQEICLRLMGKKLLVSLAMEGKFSNDGLQAIDDGDDILMAMARELVTEKGIGESADDVWRSLQKQQSEAFGGRVGEEERQSETMDVELVPDLTVPAIQRPEISALVAFATGARRPRRNKESQSSTHQLALF
jgi:hypothetical protein